MMPLPIPPGPIKDDGSDFTECKTCKQLMTKKGHDDGRCYDCRRAYQFGMAIIQNLKSIDGKLGEIATMLKQKGL